MLENKKLATKIRELRISLNMSQDRFGKRVGLTGKSISAYERGTCVPPLKVLEKISSTYEVGFSTFDDKNNQVLAEKISLLKTLIIEIEGKLLL